MVRRSGFRTLGPTPRWDVSPRCFNGPFPGGETAMDEALWKVARKQWGVFSRGQAFEKGMTKWSIRRRLLQGDWVEVESSVYRFSGGHESWHQRVSAATLAITGAMASHRTAAFLWDLDTIGGAPALLEVTAGFDQSRALRLARVHHSRRLPKQPVYRDRIATTPLVRTLLDLSDVVSAEKLFVAFDSARRKFPRLLPALEAELRNNGEGRRNADLLAKLLKRAKGDCPTGSWLEATAATAMDRHGTLPPVRQYVVRDSSGYFIGRVDFAWLEQRVILECDSHEWHLTPDQFEKDLVRRRRLESNGWRVVHVTSRMLATKNWLIDLDRLLAAQTWSANL